MLAHPAAFARGVEGRDFFRDLLEESRCDEKKMKMKSERGAKWTDLSFWPTQC